MSAVPLTLPILPLEQPRACTACGVEKPAAEFYFHRQSRRRRARCRACECTSQKAWRATNPERHRANRERRKPAERTRAMQRRMEHGRTIAERNGHLRATYGITLDDFMRLFSAQGGRCRLCDEVRLPYRDARRKGCPSGILVVDHDHATGRVRGLLCVRCNQALGMLKDDAALMEKAAQYVREEAPNG